MERLVGYGIEGEGFVCLPMIGFLMTISMRCVRSILGIRRDPREPSWHAPVRHSRSARPTASCAHSGSVPGSVYLLEAVGADLVKIGRCRTVPRAS
jgi:hypothetical protein